MAITTEDRFEADGGPTCHFNVLTTSRKRARKAAFSVRHTAYGNTNIVQLGGRLEATRDYECYVPNDGELANVDQACGLQGKLYCAEANGVVAALVGYDATTYLSTSEQVVMLTFIVDAD